MPVARATQRELRGSPMAWKLYEAVCVHFVATLLPRAQYSEAKVSATLCNSTAGRFEFGHTWHRVTERGWLHAQPWRTRELGIHEDATQALDRLRVGDVLRNVAMRVVEGRTTPPQPLRESEVITLMDAHGCGSDGTLPQHIAAIADHGYLAVEDGEGRRIGRDEPRKGGHDGGGEGGGSGGARAGSGGVGGNGSELDRDTGAEERENRPASPRPATPRASSPRPSSSPAPSRRLAGAGESALSCSSSTSSRRERTGETSAPPWQRGSSGDVATDQTPAPSARVGAANGFRGAMARPRPPGRYFVPTPLGIALVNGLCSVDEELVGPTLRARLEDDLSAIANVRPEATTQRAETNYSALAHQLVAAQLEGYAKRFEGLQARMTEAFAASFGQVASSEHERERGENAMIHQQVLSTTWSNGAGPSEWRSRHLVLPSTDSIADAPLDGASAQLDSAQARYIEAVQCDRNAGGACADATADGGAEASTASSIRSLSPGLSAGVQARIAAAAREVHSAARARGRLSPGRVSRGTSSSAGSHGQGASDANPNDASRGSTAPTLEEFLRILTSAREGTASAAGSVGQVSKGGQGGRSSAIGGRSSAIDGAPVASVGDIAAVGTGKGPHLRQYENAVRGQADREARGRADNLARLHAARTAEQVGDWDREFALEARRAAAAESTRRHASEMGDLVEALRAPPKARQAFEKIGSPPLKALNSPHAPTAAPSTPRLQRAVSPPPSPRSSAALRIDAVPSFAMPTAASRSASPMPSPRRQASPLPSPRRQASPLPSPRCSSPTVPSAPATPRSGVDVH